MKYNPIGTLVSVLNVHLTWKNDEKKERTKRKVNGKMWKGKGEQRKDCFLLLLSFIYPVSLLPCCFFSVIFCQWKQRKHISHSLHFGEAIYSEQKMGSQGPHLLTVSPTVQAHFLVPGFWSCKWALFLDAQKPQRFLSQSILCVKSNRNIPHWLKITPVDWRNFQPMPKKNPGCPSFMEDHPTYTEELISGVRLAMKTLLDVDASGAVLDEHLGQPGFINGTVSWKVMEI